MYVAAMTSKFHIPLVESILSSLSGIKETDFPTPLSSINGYVVEMDTSLVQGTFLFLSEELSGYAGTSVWRGTRRNIFHLDILRKTFWSLFVICMEL